MDNNLNYYLNLSILTIVICLIPIVILAQCTKGDCHNGEGIYQYKSGALYQGIFHNGQLDNGTYYYNNGDIYIGSYENNKRNGKGKYYYSDGRYYEGEYAKGKKTTGKMLYSNNAWYVGAFFNGKRHGTGNYYFNKEKVLEGQWKENKYVSLSKKSPTVFATIIAIEKYQNENDKLNYTVDDAELIKQNISNGLFGGTQPPNIKTIYDSEATAKNIINETQSHFSQAKEEDIAIFYYSGHGGPGVIAPIDYQSSLISYSQIKNIISECKAKTKILIVDACHSGSLLSSQKSIKQRSFAMVSDREDNIIVFMASRDKEKSNELGHLGHGLFTYFFSQGLSSKSDANNDKMITIEELYNYVRNTTYGISSTFEKDNWQCPTLVGKFDRDMIIKYVD